jgi:outer membrane protein OmpA-like peptidoglycan-associated protein
MLTKHRLKTGIYILGIAMVCSGDAAGHLAIGKWQGAKSATALLQPISLSEAERSEIAEIAKAKPSIDLDIPFEMDSAILSAAVRPSVQALGRALNNPELKGGTFVIAGFTDGLESESYSEALSLRRAEAVKYELVKSFNIATDDLVTVGYGSARLKNAINPFDRANNRVEIINMGKL